VTHLLDVNVLIALADPQHISHATAHAWFEIEGSSGFATCPLVENGLVRIISHSRYCHPLASPGDAAPFLKSLARHKHHQFWPDDLSLATSDLVDMQSLRTPGQVTDTYLLALAVSRGGRLATLDRRLSTDAVRGGRKALIFIGGQA